MPFLLKGVASRRAHVAEVIWSVCPSFALLGAHLLLDVRVGVVCEREEPLLASREVADSRRPTEPIAALVELGDRLRLVS